MARRATPEVNAGSMADIAFLLLIFYLVTTTMDVDTGLARRLPQIQDQEQEIPPFNRRNVFQIILNAQDQILVGESIREVSEIRQEVIDFLDNNGDGTCTWCDGAMSSELSDNPSKAVVSITNDRSTTYGTYLAVQNEVVAAYNFLRDRYSKENFGGKTWVEFQREEGERPDDEELLKQTQTIKDAYPLNISEAEPVDYSK